MAHFSSPFTKPLGSGLSFRGLTRLGYERSGSLRSLAGRSRPISFSFPAGALHGKTFSNLFFLFHRFVCQRDPPLPPSRPGRQTFFSLDDGDEFVSPTLLRPLRIPFESCRLTVSSDPTPFCRCFLPFRMTVDNLPQFLPPVGSTILSDQQLSHCFTLPRESLTSLFLPSPMQIAQLGYPGPSVLDCWHMY